jgi:lysozyme family protein
MRGNFDRCFAELLRHEGGYSNNPRDPGGMTNLGVTKRVYEEWVGHPVSEAIMRGLTPQHVRALYKAKYWDVVKGDDLPAGVDLCVFDFAVNAGPNRAARYLQLMVGVIADGKIGPTTLRQLQQYVRTHDIPHAINRYQDLREAYYRKLKTFATFGRGWLRRNSEVRQAALKMAA